MKKKTGYYINCENCGKEIYQTKTQYNRSQHHFCSNKCQMEFQHRQTHEDRVCEICGTLFHVSKKSTQRFCSPECQCKWQTTCVGKDNPRYTSVEKQCECCNKSIAVKPYKIKNGQHLFCSNSCRQKWYADVWSQTPEWKEESRKRATRILSENKPTTYTKPQQILNMLLDELSISYVNEYNCVYYSIDNYLPNYNLMIEVMGDFWHAHPLKYNVTNYREIQKRRIIKDKAKHTYILNNYHIEILYIWEDDLYHNIDLCKLLIQNYLMHPNEMITYHSYNYHIEDNQLTINQNII